MDIRDMFSYRVRRRVAQRIFDRPGTTYRCAEGYCVVGALLHEAGISAPSVPGPSMAYAVLYGRALPYGDPRYRLLRDLRWHNDHGEYADRAALRAALLPEEVRP